MKKKDFLKIINEEITNFDFLGNDEFLKEQEVNDLLLNGDLQKQFICDSLLGRNDKVRIVEIEDSHITGNWNEGNMEDADRITLVYYLKIEYKYDIDKDSLFFDLNFDADKIDIGINGWSDSGSWENYVEPSGEAWFDGFDWTDIDISIYNETHDDINFIAFDNAPPKIQVLFIRHYLQNFIESETLEIRTRDMKDNIQNTPYC